MMSKAGKTVKKHGSQAVRVNRKIQKRGSKVKKIVKNVKKKLKVKRNIKRPILPEAERGVVYLSHLPHGFYEEQIQKYFQQFGKVTGLNVPRSKSGRTKGYAFIEFLHPEVAKIAADAMNNYLMFDRLLKAKYIPPEEQKPQKFFYALKDKTNNRTPKDLADLFRNKDKKNKSKQYSEEEEKAYIKKKKGQIQALHKKLSKHGVDYDFQVANESVQLKKVTPLSEDKEKVIVEVDESDDEISFKTPPNAIKKLITKSELKAKSNRPLFDNKQNEKKEEETKLSKRSLKNASKSVVSVIKNNFTKERKMKLSPKQRKSLDSLTGLSQEKPKKSKTKTETETKGGGILKKFGKGETVDRKEKKSSLVGIRKSKDKPAKAETGKLKKKLKGLNLAGVKQMMDSFV